MYSDQVDVPAKHVVTWLAAKPLAMQFRSLFLYGRIPYDKSIFYKLYDPVYYFILMITASPNVFVRGLFFTIYLLLICHDREEYQTMR